MYVSPRPTDSLKSLPTQKFLFEFPIEILFFSGISGPFRHRYFRFCILLQPKLLLIRLWEWFCKHVFRLLLVEMIASYKKRPRTWKIVIIKLNSFEKTFWWSCKYKSRSKKFTCPFRLVPMKFLLSDGRITCPGLRASGLRRRLFTNSNTVIMAHSYKKCPIDKEGKGAIVPLKKN
jgi:hypothetical protein